MPLEPAEKPDVSAGGGSIVELCARDISTSFKPVE
jgi:hypothetical protein